MIAVFAVFPDLLRAPGCALAHMVPDLFGEIPVSLADVLAWMITVPGIPPTSARFGYYVRHYQVIAKIRAAKRSGTFDAVLNADDRPAPFRLAAAIRYRARRA